MTGSSPLPGRPGYEATGQEEYTVLLATILSCHALAGDTGWWLCGGQAAHRRDDSHGLLPLFWTMQSGPPKYFILHKSPHVVRPATTGDVKLICGSMVPRSPTGVMTRLSSS